MIIFVPTPLGHDNWFSYCIIYNNIRYTYNNSLAPCSTQLTCVRQTLTGLSEEGGLRHDLRESFILFNPDVCVLGGGIDNRRKNLIFYFKYYY